MSAASALPYPPDEPDEIRSRARGLLTMGESLGDAGARITAERFVLAMRWSGQASAAAGEDLDALAGVTREAAVALRDGAGPLFAYGDGLDEARSTIDSLRSSYDQLMDAPAPAGERARDDAEALQAELRELRELHQEVIDRTEVDAEQTGRALEGIGRRASLSHPGATPRTGVETQLLDRLPLLQQYRIATDGSGTEAARDLADELRALLARYEREGTSSWDELAPLLDGLQRRLCDPGFAATLLDLLGADAFVRLPDLIRAAAFDSVNHQANDRLVDGVGALATALVTASHTLGLPGGLSQRFVDDLAGRELDDGVAGDDVPRGKVNQIDQIQDALAAAGLADDVAKPVANAVSAGRIAAVLDGTGKLLLVTAVTAPVVDAVQGEWGDAAVSTVTAGLSVYGAISASALAAPAIALAGLITIVTFAATSPGSRSPTTASDDPPCHTTTGASRSRRDADVPNGAG